MFKPIFFFHFFSIIGNTNTFNLRVKVESPTGLLLWTGGDEMSPASDFLLLGLENGFLHFRFNLGNGEGGVIYNQSKIDDGKWHRIRASRYVLLPSSILQSSSTQKYLVFLFGLFRHSLYVQTSSRFVLVCYIAQYLI